eukprot:COSAG01_NODE_5587_length_4162_cov_3.658627_2_plen_125_part_00
MPRLFWSRNIEDANARAAEGVELQWLPPPPPRDGGRREGQQRRGRLTSHAVHAEHAVVPLPLPSLPLQPPPPPPAGSSCFTFIELFAGIGGFRVGLEALGGRCVFTSEIEPEVRRPSRLFWRPF